MPRHKQQKNNHFAKPYISGRNTIPFALQKVRFCGPKPYVLPGTVSAVPDKGETLTYFTLSIVTLLCTLPFNLISILPDDTSTRLLSLAL